MPLNPTPNEGTDVAVLPQDAVSPDHPWTVLLKNDPVNIMGVVVLVLVRVLQCDVATAERYMLLAHAEGQAAVFTGTLPEATRIAAQLKANQLWADVRQQGGDA